MSDTGRLGEFEVIRRIGAGGMAEVFLAKKRGAKGTEKRLVVKRLLPQHVRSERLRTMFVHEAHLAIRLAHPNLVHVYELSDDPEGGLLLSMEYVDGADLARILTEVKRRGAKLPAPIALRIVEQAARGLHYAHEYKDDGAEPLAIVHRDISPQNILVSRGGVVKVADLGVASARFVRDETGVQPGKLRYMAPEQARGERVDRRCDVYSLGVVLYETLRLASPYGDRRGAALARAVSHGRLDPPLTKLDDLPEDVRSVLEGALAPDPSHRTRTARDLADAIAAVLLARGAHVDDAAIEAALAPLIDSAGQLPAARSGASEDASSSSSGSGSGSADPTPASDAGSTPARPSSAEIDDVPTVATAARDRPRESHPPCPAGLRPGDAFDRYVLEGRIGHGGMAEVFRARDTRLGREVALKLLRTDSDAASRERMLVEAQAAATFEHPGSVVVFDVGEHHGVPFIAMELVRGRTLSTYLGEEDVPIPRRVRWSAAIARVLAAAHRAGLVHRDVKPSNVMIKEDGDVKVLDFGIVRRRVPDSAATFAPALTQAGAIIGTPGYAAPEQLRGDAVDGRADQFAWAVTTYELLAGRRPWTGESTGVVVARTLLEPFEPLRAVAPGVPAEVAHVIERALSREPEERFASLDEAADHLAPFCEPEPLPAPRGPFSSVSLVPPPPAEDASARSFRPGSLPDAARPSSPSLFRAPSSPIAWIAAFATAAALGGVVAYTFTRGDSPPATAVNPPPADVRAPVIASIRCEPATPAAAQTLASTVAPALDPGFLGALGVGACARLAVDLGVPWSDAASPTALTVRVAEGDTGTRVELAIAGRTSTGTAREPMRAVDLAVAALAPRLSAPPLSPQEIKAWGATDDASARRIARVFRRRDLRITADIGAEAVRLLDTDPDSPFSHLLVLMISAGSSEVLDKARDRTLSLLDRLPPSRRHLVRGLLLVYPGEIDRKEAARLMRRSYAEAPDDHEMVGLYVVMCVRFGLPEAFGVLDRLIAAAPTHSVVPLENAILRAADDNPERSERYARKWAEILPEARAAQPIVQALVRAGKLDEARAAIDFGKRLGLPSMGEPVTYEGGLMDIQLVGLETSQARERARSVLADPRPFARTLGANIVVSAHFLDGHAGDALSALASGIKLGLDAGDVEGTSELLVRALSAGRWLHRPTHDPAQLDWLTQKATAQDQLSRAARAESLVEIALAAQGADADQRRRDVLDAIEAEARAAGDDPILHDDLLLQTIPLVRAVRGDRLAAAVFRAAARARTVVRARPSIDAALAFEALGDPASAARVYETLADPILVRRAGIERVIAAVRLRKLRARAPDLPEGRDHALYDHLASRADPGLIEAIEKLR